MKKQKADTPSRYVVQRLAPLVYIPEHEIPYVYCIRKKYGTKSQKKYGRTHGKPAVICIAESLAQNIRDALNNGTVQELRSSLSKDEQEELSEVEQDKLDEKHAASVLPPKDIAG